MRIAFVGKGGSGKSALSALFVTYLSNKYPEKNVYAVDADLNIHLPRYLGFKLKSKNFTYLSDSRSMQDIRNYLINKNTRIKHVDHFRKTTPPAIGSNIVDLADKNNYIFKNYALNRKNIFLSVVGTYSKGKIGQSCYHDHLSIFENILSHSLDRNSYLVADMVAGIDAFSGSLYAQFDILIVVVEPSRASFEVFDQYLDLAKEADIQDLIRVVGNKARSDDDVKYILKLIPKKYLLGVFSYSKHVENVDRGIENLDLNKLEKNDFDVLANIDAYINKIVVDENSRLQRLYDVHRKYVSQDYVLKRYGDLTSQIDNNFKF
ncbi:MAG: hypothetical protein N2558_04015 [Patescibacteria group bacterium]|nr:hypothetical protein [Patescibacteria group bacterium]